MNDLYIILLPVLPSVVLYAVVITVLYVREKLKGHDEQAYQELREAYAGNVAQLAIAEEELERLQGQEKEVERLQVQNETVTTLKANFEQENVRLKGLLADTRHQRDELNAENAKLHAQVKLLIDTFGAKVDGITDDTAAIQAIINRERGHVDVETTVTQDDAKPRRSHKRQATDTASN